MLVNFVNITEPDYRLRQLRWLWQGFHCNYKRCHFKCSIQ